MCLCQKARHLSSQKVSPWLHLDQLPPLIQSPNSFATSRTHSRSRCHRCPHNALPSSNASRCSLTSQRSSLAIHLNQVFLCCLHSHRIVHPCTITTSAYSTIRPCCCCSAPSKLIKQLNWNNSSRHQPRGQLAAWTWVTLCQHSQPRVRKSGATLYTPLITIHVTVLQIARPWSLPH